MLIHIRIECLFAHWADESSGEKKSGTKKAALLKSVGIGSMSLNQMSDLDIKNHSMHTNHLKLYVIQHAEYFFRCGFVELKLSSGQYQPKPSRFTWICYIWIGSTTPVTIEIVQMKCPRQN